jgi:hypothetical protein
MTNHKASTNDIEDIDTHVVKIHYTELHVDGENVTSHSPTSNISVSVKINFCYKS